MLEILDFSWELREYGSKNLMAFLKVSRGPHGEVWGTGRPLLLQVHHVLAGF